MYIHHYLALEQFRKHMSLLLRVYTSINVSWQVIRYLLRHATATDNLIVLCNEFVFCSKTVFEIINLQFVGIFFFYSESVKKIY